MEVCSCIINERRYLVMSAKKKKSLIKKILENPIIVSVISDAVFAFLIFCIGRVGGVLTLPSRVEKLEKNVETLLANSNSPETYQNAPVINNYFGLKPVGEGILKVSTESIEMPYLLSAPTWGAEDIIAENEETGEKITASQLVNEKIFLPCISDDQENYFYVRFNENNQWDGECITNIYKNDILISIMEAQYDNGELLHYRQAVKDTTRNQIDIWRVCDKERKKGKDGEYNSGQTWNYIYKEYKKDFDDRAQVKDLKYIDEFEVFLKQNTWLEGYYNGNTANGFYNDKTGNSYLIKYFEDGTVRTIYYGNFVKGEFDDRTGNAWYITRGKNTDYMYYKGFYKGGVTENNPGHIFESPPLSVERIKEILKENGCNLDLNWYDSDNKE